MKRSLVSASLVGFFAAPAFAAADPASATDASGASVVASDDATPDASAGARGGGGGRGGGARGGGGGGGSGKGGGGHSGGGHSGAGKGGGGHAGGKGGHSGGHADAPRAGDAPAASHHGNASVSNHPNRAPAPSSRAPAHAPSRTVANKTVRPGSPPRAAHNPAAVRAVYNAKPAHHSAVVFPRWRPSYHRYHLGPGVHAHWTHGVFIYSPPPARRMVGGEVVESGTSNDLRAVNRNGDFGIGVTAGSLMSTYRGGVGSYGDFGMGLTLTWRPTEVVGFEGAWGYHTDSWDEEVDSERESEVLAGSMKLYAMPWTRVAPYLSVGVTATERQFQDTYSDGFSTQTESVHDTLVGPHVGLGVELAVGKSAAFDFEGRAIGYMNKLPEDPAAPFAFQTTGGLKLYF